MEFDFTKMTACDEPFYGVVPDKAAYPIGRVCQLVTFGTEENFRTEYLTLEVADFRSSYHAIFGRPILAKFMARLHHTYLIMKMPVPNGILSVLGNIMVSYNCESATVELSKDSAIKAATTVRVTQAAKIDQTTLQVPEQKRTSTALDPSRCQESLPRPARRIQGSGHRGRPQPQIGTRAHQLPQGQR
jgi:hypothetical protein